jgi:transporter family protein
MISWIILTILAAIILAASYIIDKFVLIKQKPIVIAIFSTLVFLVGPIFIFLIKGVPKISLIAAVFSMLTGFFSFITIYFYCKAVQEGEVSRIVPLISTSVIFTLILSTIFLKEIFSFWKYIGIGLIFCGSILISSNKKTKLIFDKGFFLAIITAIFSGITSVLIKYSLNLADYWAVFSYQRIGAFLLVMPFIFIMRKELIKFVKNKKKAMLVSLSVLISLFAMFLITIAISIGFVSLVTSLISIQDLFLLLFTFILGIFFPKILNEEINAKIVIVKTIAIVTLLFGVILITT